MVASLDNEWSCGECGPKPRTTALSERLCHPCEQKRSGEEEAIRAENAKLRALVMQLIDELDIRISYCNDCSRPGLCAHCSSSETLADKARAALDAAKVK